jgi:hypothetical protein
MAHQDQVKVAFISHLHDGLGRDFRQEWLAKIDDTPQTITQAMERARAQKQTSARTAAPRAEEVDQRLTEILKLEGALRALKARIEKSLTL